MKNNAQVSHETVITEVLPRATLKCRLVMKEFCAGVINTDGKGNREIDKKYIRTTLQIKACLLSLLF